MRYADLLARALAKPGARQDEPWEGDVAVSAYVGRYGWNAFTLDGTMPEAEIPEALDASYDDVVSRLPKSKLPNLRRPQ